MLASGRRVPGTASVGAIKDRSGRTAKVRGIVVGGAGRHDEGQRSVGAVSLIAIIGLRRAPKAAHNEARCVA